MFCVSDPAQVCSTTFHSAGSPRRPVRGELGRWGSGWGMLLFELGLARPRCGAACRHTGAFVRFRDGTLDQVLPPTGREIDVEHLHVLTRRGDQVVAHEALRGDLAMIRQLGFLPPRPAAIAGIAGRRLSGRATRAGAAAVAIQLCDQAAGGAPVGARFDPELDTCRACRRGGGDDLVGQAPPRPRRQPPSGPGPVGDLIPVSAAPR